MRIEKLEPSRHKQGRWLVWFEDGSLLRVSEGDVVRLSLYQGQELSEQEATALTAAAGQSKLVERAADLLSARSMSRRELVDKLTTPPRRRRKPGEEPGPEPDPEVLAAERETLLIQAEAAADRMERLGLLDDRAYAEAIVRHYGGKGFGERKLRDELYRRGVPRELWDEALAGRERGGEDLYRLAERKLHGQPSTRENLKRVSDFLARRGYGWEEISAALERLGEIDYE